MTRYTGMTDNNHLMCFLFAMAAALCIATTAPAVVIDDFTVGPQNVLLQDQSSDLSQTSLSGDHVLGGRRGVDLWGNGGSTSLVIDTTNGGKAIVDVADGWGYLALTYGTTENPLNLNLAAIGHDTIRLRYRISSVSGTTYVPGWYRVYGTGQQIDIPFANTASDNIIEVISSIPASNDLTDIDKIEVNILRIPAGTTIELIDIITVPEPTFALLLLTPMLLRRK